MRRIHLSQSRLFVLAFLVTLVSAGPARGAETITYVSWGGAYLKSQVEAYLKPYTAQTGVRFDIKNYAGGLEEIKAQIEAGKVEWQLVDMEAKDVILGCESGLLEPLDHSMLPPGDNGKPASEDFVTGALHECGVGTVSWATIVAYDDTMYPDDKPASIEDFWDTAKFPGQRGLRKTVDVNLEWALIADGVSPNRVYDVLATSSGVERAFESLDKIKQHVVWWEDAAKPPQMLADGEVAMTSAFNGRVYDAMINDDKPLVILWDTQIWDLDFWGIPKGAKNQQAVFEFVKFATGTRPLAESTNYISYGPLRKSSARHVNPAILPHLPTASKNIENALRFDSTFWGKHKKQLSARFDEWLVE